MGNRITSSDTRSRLVSTALLVLVALGGAGLAVAADRPQSEALRPELTRAADQAARPYIDAAYIHLAALDEATVDVSRAGRDALGQLQALDVDAVRDSLTNGAAAVLAADEANAALGLVVAESHARIERWRLGPDTAERLDAVDAAFESANGVVPTWVLVEDRATIVSELLDLLNRHDAQVFRATTAGRQSRWTDAIQEMTAASPLLSEADEIRGRLASVADTSTLADLLERYAAYDSALVALYEHVADTGQQQGEPFRDRQAAVDRAQEALPSDNRVLSLIVAETAGNAIAEALVDLEQVRGDILAALDAGTSE